jgi:3,4-dihydroxy 2-butanone 4-phosphate synthase / GTP cyclohydrolase II
MSNKQVEMSPIEDVVAAIARGEMIVMVDDEDRENEGDLIMAAQFATAEKIAFIVRHTSGVVVAPLSGERCDDLRLPLMVDNNTESHRTAFTISVDLLEGTSTGISAADRAATLRGLADPNSFSFSICTPRAHLPVARPRRRRTEARRTYGSCS